MQRGVAQRHNNESNGERSEQPARTQRLASDQDVDGTPERVGHRAGRCGQRVETGRTTVTQDAVSKTRGGL